MLNPSTPDPTTIYSFNNIPLHKIFIHCVHFCLRVWLILPYLARENIPKCRECIIQCFVVNAFIQVLDKHISNTRFSDWWISLGPHDSDGTTFDGIEVHSVQSSFSWNNSTSLNSHVYTFQTPSTPAKHARGNSHIVCLGNDFKGENGITITITYKEEVKSNRNFLINLPSAGCWKFTYAYPSERRVIMSRHTRIDSTGPAEENFSKSIASVTSGCKSPTYKDAIG